MAKAKMKKDSKIKKAQSGLSLLAKYAGESAAKRLDKSLAYASMKRKIEQQATNKLPYKARVEATKHLEEPRSFSSMFGSARKDFQSATRPAAQSAIKTVPKSSSTVKNSIRKNYEGYKKGGSIKKSSKKK